jgi:S1-C subfamily serine protease
VANKALVSDFFGLEVYEIPQGAGSGFVWDTEGHIVSNFHVVHRASALSVTFPDGSSFEATLVGIDPGHDLAVLRVKAPAEKLVSVELGSSAALRVGQKAFAIGNPFGLDTSLSAGIVSALGRTMTAMNGQTIHEVIQTDAAINPGNSGGPLLDAAGRLIGVNTAIVSTSGGYAGVGFAVPSDTVRRIVPQLISRGRASRAGFGIRLVPDHLTRQSGVSGAAILQVVPGGAAERAGLRGVARDRGGRLRFGDVVTALDGSPVRSNDDLTALLDRMSVGDRARLTCRRDGRDREVEVTLHDLDD